MPSQQAAGCSSTTDAEGMAVAARQAHVRTVVRGLLPPFLTVTSRQGQQPMAATQPEGSTCRQAIVKASCQG